MTLNRMKPMSESQTLNGIEGSATVSVGMSWPWCMFMSQKQSKGIHILEAVATSPVMLILRSILEKVEDMTLGDS